MKKVLGLVGALVLATSLTACAGKTDLKIGQVEYAAHGTKCFAVTTVVMNGDKIAEAYIDEFQFMDAATSTLVPNSDADFGVNFADPAKGLGSKRANNDAYSAHMAEEAGSTVDLVSNYEAIQNFAEGKTVAELEKAVADKAPAEVIDAVSGATLVDTPGYLQSIIEAAKAAK